MKIDKNSVCFAYPTFCKNPRETLIIFADDCCDARIKASKFYGHSSVTVGPLKKTKDKYVYKF